jgi:hypothetical protein
MKRFLYFILLLAGFSSIHSCKDMLDEDGNPLIDLNNNTGLNGARALYREITDEDTLAEYHYNGLAMTKVFTPGLVDRSVTDIMYSGDKVSKITYKGHLDGDGDGDPDIDSTSYTQLFTYGNSGRLESISENRETIIIDLTPTPPTVTIRKTKTLYKLTYSPTTNKLDKIVMNTGEEVPAVTFEYKNYSETTYAYSGDNISKVLRNYGPMTGGVHAPPVSKYSYEFSNYDDKISPFSLLPFAYKISRILSATEANDAESFILSPNSPKRMAITDLVPPVPTPVVFSTDYNYDVQTYMTKGFGVNYIYKPL